MFIPLSYNTRSLLQRKATTLATAFGIALVVFVLASSLMLSRGIERTLVSTGAQDRVVVLRKGSAMELSSSIDPRTVGTVLSAPGVSMENNQPLGTGEVVVVVALDKLGLHNKVSNIQVRGVTEVSYALRKKVKLIDGRAAAPGADELVIGKSLRGRFRGMDLGQRLELKKGRPMEVVGIMDAGGTAFDSEVWCDAAAIRSIFGRGATSSSVLIELQSAQSYKAFKRAVEHDQRLGLEVFREHAYYEKLSEGTSILITALGFLVTFFFSIGAMIGATITMYAAVAQRTREIGTLQALGFSRTAVLASFLFESTVVALLGGATGAIASLSMGALKFSMMNFATWQEITFSFDPSVEILVGSALTGGAMGIVGGFFPAVRAARTSPAAAMRS